MEGREFLVGNEISIADIIWFPWVVCLDKFYSARDLLEIDKRAPNVVKWVQRLEAIPAVAKGMSINNFETREDYSSP